MTVRVSKPEFNLREKLTELDYSRVPYEKMPAGSVIQFRYYGSTFASFATSSTSYVDSGIVCPFTPKFSNSVLKVEFKSRRFNLVTGHVMQVGITRTNNNTFIGSAVDLGGHASKEIYEQNNNSSASNQIATGMYYAWLDIPNTIENIDYRVRVKKYGGTGSVYLADSGGIQVFVTEIKQ